MLPFEFDRRNNSDGGHRSSPTSRHARGSSTLAGRELYKQLVAHARAPGEEEPPFARGFPSPHRYATATQTPELRLGATDRSVRGVSSVSMSYYDEAGGRTGRSRADARSVGSTPSPLRSGTRTFTGKRRASGEMASFFSADADELDDGLEFDRRSGGSDFAAIERANYHAVGYDGVARGWAAPYHARRSADEQFTAQFSRQYDLRHHDDAIDALYSHGEQEEKRQSTGRYRLGTATASTGSSSAHYRISGLRISPASTTSGSSRNAPRTGNETRQHVMPEMRTARDRLMSGAAGMSTGAIAAAASAAPASASASASSSPVLRDASASAPASVSVVRPIANASRNIKFAMLQPHFERPLQEAALKFGVCTTLFKKICRKNGIANWPFRKICGLRKSIASMEKQVQYFDGEQKKSYAEQLRKLQVELEAYKRIGTAPTPEFVRLMDEEEAAVVADEPEDSTGDKLFVTDNQVEAGGEGVDDAEEGKYRAESDVEDDDELLAKADSEEQQRQRATERVSPLQRPEPCGPDPPVTKHSVSRSSSSRAVHYSRPDSAREYQNAQPSGSGGRYDGHFHQDQVHSRPPTFVDHEYVPEHHAYHHQRHQHQPERHFHHEQHHHQHHQHFHDHQAQHQRARPHPQGMSTIGIHQRALPSIDALLQRQGRDPAMRPDARDDSSSQYYDQRDDYQ